MQALSSIQRGLGNLEVHSPFREHRAQECPPGPELGVGFGWWLPAGGAAGRRSEHPDQHRHIQGPASLQTNEHRAWNCNGALESEVLECGVRAGAAEELKCGVGLPSRWRRGLCCPRGRENERAGRCRCACRWPARAQAMPRRPPPQWSPDLLLRLRQPPAASSQQPAAAKTNAKPRARGEGGTPVLCDLCS